MKVSFMAKYFLTTKHRLQKSFKYPFLQQKKEVKTVFEMHQTWLLSLLKALQLQSSFEN